MSAMVLDAGDHSRRRIPGGELLGTTRTKDVVDATVALLVRSDDRVYTSDTGDLSTLCAAAGIKAVVIGC
jgi:hypothetical protein